MKRTEWEYLTEKTPRDSAVGGMFYEGVPICKDLLKTRGSEGWELVTIYDGHAYFKRPVEGKPNE